MNNIIAHIENHEPSQTSFKDNLTREERTALREIKEATDIVIKKADKGNTLVILSKDFYRDKLVLADHLDTDTYGKAPKNADKKVSKDLTKLIEKYSDCLTRKEKEYILKEDWTSSHFYVLPKIHKNEAIIDVFKRTDSEYVQMQVPPNLKGRPITAGPNSPTRPLSELLEKILSPFVPRLRTYVKDDRYFLTKLPQWIDYDCKLISCDVVSLYTSIPLT